MKIPIANSFPAAIMVDTSRIQYAAIIGSALLLFFIFELARKGKMRVQYALLWFFVAGLFLAISIWRDALDAIARFVGIAYPPAALFLILIVGIVGILIHFSIVLTSLSERTRSLVQELGTFSLELKRQKTDATFHDSASSSIDQDHE